MNEWVKRRTPKRCGYCKHWKRNQDFPNAYGTCKRPFVPTQDKVFPVALRDAETHEKFGCTGFDYQESATKPTQTESRPTHQSTGGSQETMMYTLFANYNEYHRQNEIYTGKQLPTLETAVAEALAQLASNGFYKSVTIVLGNSDIQTVTR